MFLSRDHSWQQYKTQVNSRFSFCYRARLADLGQDTRVIERGGERREGGVEAWLWPRSKYLLSY